MKIFRLITIALIMLLIFLVSYDITYQWSCNDKDSIKINEVPNVAANDNKESIISNITELYVEIYNADDGSTVKYKEEMPGNYIGLNRMQLAGKLQDYMLNQNRADKAKGLLTFELIDFDKDKVTLRKTYSERYLPKAYVLKEDNGMVNVYFEDGVTLYDKSNIKVERLPDSIKRGVEKGLRIGSIEALYDFLESFTS